MLPKAHLICLVIVFLAFSVSLAFNSRPRVDISRRAFSNLGLTSITRRTRTRLQYVRSVKAQTYPIVDQSVIISQSQYNELRSFAPPSSTLENLSSKKIILRRNTGLLAARRYSFPRRSYIVPHYQQSNMPIVTYLLIGINVLVFALSTVDPGYKYRLMKVNSLISRGQLYRLGTALFLHSSLGHIFNNMSSLWQLGPMVSVFLISLLCHLIREHICT